jgi:hypothetical protein
LRQFGEGAHPLYLVILAKARILWTLVIPAQVGIQLFVNLQKSWIPAFARMRRGKKTRNSQVE